MPLSNSPLLSTPRHAHIRRTIRLSRFSSLPHPPLALLNRTCHGLARRVRLEQEMVLDALLQRAYFALNLLGGAAMLLLLVTLAIPGPNRLFSRSRVATLTSLCFSRLISAVFSCLLCVPPPSAVNLVGATKLSTLTVCFPARSPDHRHRIPFVLPKLPSLYQQSLLYSPSPFSVSFSTCVVPFLAFRSHHS